MGWSLLIKLLILMNHSKLSCVGLTLWGVGEIQLILFCLQSILGASGGQTSLSPSVPSFLFNVGKGEGGNWGGA